jgi:mono/diheme cytochrome c family protein
LIDGVTLRQFPDVLKHLEFVTGGSDFEKAYGARGVGTGRMPGFGQMLSEAQIRAIVEYERSL